MKIWILEPSKEWKHCYGAIVVAADSLKEAETLVNKKEEEEYGEYGEYHHFYNSEQDIASYTDSWVLTAVFEVFEITEKQIILNNWEP